MGLLSRASNLPGIANKADDAASRPASKKIELSNEERSLLSKKISQYNELYRDFGCILFENTHHGRGRASFCKKISEMIRNVGIVIQINNGLPLILIPAEMDVELIIHRLSKSLNAKPILFFRANNPEYVINQLS